MSEPSAKREWRFFLDDMIDFCETVLTYTQDLDQQAFIASRLHFDATVRNVELIGEAATHIPEEIKRLAPDIPWRQVIAKRNRLINAYLGVDNDTLWSIVRDDIPRLLPLLLQLNSATSPSQ